MSAGDPLFWHRLQFAFTIVYHYLFPQLTMGLALLIVVMKGIGLRTGDTRWDDAARFWIRIFGINFAVGVVTGIPMEFQFGTNWARFAAIAGSVVGQTLAMEGVFAFFLESSFLFLLIFGERRLGRRGHFAAALALFAGSWLSGYFIICSNAFMQYPVGHAAGPDGTLRLADFWTFVLNPWAIAAYLHTMTAAVVTGSFVVAAVGAYYALRGEHAEAARRFLVVGTTAGLISSVLVAFPTGDRHAKLVARYQPVALAAMEGRFTSGSMAGITLIGQPNVAASPTVHAGTALFTLIGFAGLYFVLGLLFLYLVGREIAHGPRTLHG
jgi:cytochrome d ubiquinol oxidase subunit I